MTSGTRERNVLLADMWDSFKVSRNKTRHVRAGNAQDPGDISYIVNVSSTVFGENAEVRSRRIVKVMKMIRRHNRPRLWMDIVQQVVDDGKLKITDGALTKKTVDDVAYVLKNCDMSGVTTLE